MEFAVINTANTGIFTSTFLSTGKNIIFQLFHAKNYVKISTKRDVQTTYLVMIIKLLRFNIVHNYFRYHHAVFKINRTILSQLNYRSVLTVTGGQKYGLALFVENSGFKKTLSIA